MEALLIGVASSLVASLVFALVSAYFASTKFRKQLTIAFSQLTGSGIEYVYPNEQNAGPDMAKAVRRSKEVAFLSFRGFRILSQDRPLHFLLEKGCPVNRLRFLCADPESEAALKRATEYSEIDTSYSVKRYIEDIKFSVNAFSHHMKANPKVEVRLHREDPSFRVLITDGYLFLSFLLPDVSGHESDLFRVSSHSPLYAAFCRYFDSEWEKATRVKTDDAAVEKVEER